MVRILVANTDFEWFETLSNLPAVDEVNFWQPSGANEFRALATGELLAFRLKAPRNVIAGFGVFQHASRLPVSLAWDTFKENNGAASYEQMRRRVEKYRGGEPVGWNTPIGCRVLTQRVFLPPIAWIPSPASWPRNIVTGKTYVTDEAEGRVLWDRFAEAMALWPHAGEAVGGPAVGNGPGPRYGEPVLVKPRLGQGAFRVSVMDAYGRACAVSGGRVLPALEAAHIRPYAAGGEHAVTNGILMRRDIHSVFDAGYVTIDRDLRFVVSERVKSDFNNGNEYRRLHGTRLADALRPEWAPDLGALAWHNGAVFLG